MARWLVVGSIALVVLVLSEVVSRSVVTLSDSIVPIVVLPLTALAVGTGIGLTKRGSGRD